MRITAGQIAPEAELLIDDAGRLVLRGPAGEVAVEFEALARAMEQVRPVVVLVANSPSPIEKISAPVERSLERFGCKVERLVPHATWALRRDRDGYTGIISDQPDGDRYTEPGGQKFSWSCPHAHQYRAEARKCAQAELDQREAGLLNYDGAIACLLEGPPGGAGLILHQADALLRDARNSPDQVVSQAHGVTVRCSGGTRWQVTWHGGRK